MRKIVVSIFAVVCLSNVIFADTVYLDDGSVSKGEIISQTESKIIIDTESGREEISAQFVKKVIKSASQKKQSDVERRVVYDRDGNESGNMNSYSVCHRKYELIFKSGVNLNGKHHVDGNYIAGSVVTQVDSTQNIDKAFSFGGEYVRYLNKNLGLGAGINFQMPRKATGGDGNFVFTPVYLLVKVRPEGKNEKMCPYTVGHLGYNLMQADKVYKGKEGNVIGGLYYGVGEGLVFGNTFLELLFSVNRGYFSEKVTAYDRYWDIDYSTIMISYGIIF